MRPPLTYLVTGTGYCGTQYAARLLTSVGVPCTHECFFRGNGPLAPERWWDRLKKISPQDAVADSNCFAAHFLDHWLLAGATVIHLVRDPMLVLRGQWKKYYVRPTDDFPAQAATENAIRAACGWYWSTNAEIEIDAGAPDGPSPESPYSLGPYVRVRIEDCPDALLKAVGRETATDYFEPQTPAQRNSHWERGSSQAYAFELGWDRVPAGPERTQLEAMSRRYGYLP